MPLDTVRGLFLDLGRHSIQCAFAPEQPFVRPRSLRLQVDVVFCKPVSASRSSSTPRRLDYYITHISLFIYCLRRLATVPVVCLHPGDFLAAP